MIHHRLLTLPCRYISNFKLSKTVKDVQWSFISLVTSSFAHLLLRIVLSKELGPSSLGLYTLVFTVYMFGLQFAAFGVGPALTKYIAEYQDDLSKIKEFVSSGIFGALISGSIMGALLYLLSSLISIEFFHSPIMVDFLKITAVCFPFIAMQKVVIGTLNGLQRMKLYAILNIAQNLSVMLVTIFFVLWLKMNLMGAILGFVIPTILMGLLSLAFIRNIIPNPPKFVYSTIKEISYFGFYVVLANSIGMINTQIDSLMIGHFMAESEVGYYAVAIIFMQGVILLPQAIQSVTNPSISAYYRKREYEKIQKLIKNTMLKTFAAVICISIILAIFGKYFICIIFTEEFLPAYTPMIILLIGYSICAPIGSVGTTLSSVGKVELLFKITTLAALMNTLLNFILIPKYGINGAAVATSISQIGILAIHLSFIKKYVFDYILP
ncbi:MAG TPA: flippase [Methanobacterium sp.]|nr:flippase [Methanobacterium sp.]